MGQQVLWADAPATQTITVGWAELNGGAVRAVRRGKRAVDRDADDVFLGELHRLNGTAAT